MAPKPGRPDPELLALELRVVLRSGPTVARLTAALSMTPELRKLVATEASSPLSRYDAGLALRNALELAVVDLGTGPLGRAATALLGARDSSRGLSMAARRREAASELGITSATLVRHHEAEILLEVAIALSRRKAQ